MESRQARLLGFRDIAPEVRHFEFDVPEAERIEFTPGQFVSLSGPVDGRIVTRSYSIASAPNGGNHFELCLNRVKEGLFSPWLFELKPGECTTMKGPLGYFVPRSPFRNSVFVATGTGIAPIRSFLQTPAIRDSGARLVLLFGNRYREGVLYHTEFEQLAAGHPNFIYMPTLTRPDAGWTGRTGRVQAHLDEALGGSTDLDVYVCGLAEMVNDLRSLLKERGLEKKQVIVEKYD